MMHSIRRRSVVKTCADAFPFVQINRVVLSSLVTQSLSPLFLFRHMKAPRSTCLYRNETDSVDLFFRLGGLVDTRFLQAARTGDGLKLRH